MVNGFSHSKKRSFFIAILFLVAIRLLFFLATIIWPIPNEIGRPVSPLVESGTDLLYYKNMAAKLTKNDALTIFDQYRRFYGNLRIPDISTIGTHATLTEIRQQAAGLLEYLNVGPAFPLMLHVSNYGPGNTLPLAIFFLILSLIGGAVWLFWLRAAGVPLFWLILFGLLPGPLYFTISLGTDLPFIFATGIFLYAYTGDRQRSAHVFVWFSAIVLMALLRPTALSILVFVLIDMCFRQGKRNLTKTHLTATIAVFCLCFTTITYYLPHGIHVIGGTTQLIYFGVTVGEYYGGLFSGLPNYLDKFISLVLLFGAKICYFVGLRPSFGDTANWIVLLRAAPGLVLLPGLVWGLIWSGWRMRLFLVLYLIPIVAGPAQDRYSLPIQPVLLFCCACAYCQIIMILFRSKLGNTEHFCVLQHKYLNRFLFKPTRSL